jgi:hypothetical protein
MMQDFQQLVGHVKEFSDGPPDADEPHFIGGVYAKEFHLAAGQILVSHQHIYDHMSILAIGEAILITADGEQHLTGPAVVNIKAREEHALQTLTDIVWFCIHAVDMATEAYQTQDPHSTDGMLIIKGAV